jgi:transcriptional regulator with XRE-family HTH domain
MPENRPQKHQHPTGKFIDDPISKLHLMRAIRKAAGWSQVDIANHLNVPQSAVSKWENKTTRPDFANGYRLIILLDQLQLALLNPEVTP